MRIHTDTQTYTHTQTFFKRMHNVLLESIARPWPVLFPFVNPISPLWGTQFRGFQLLGGPVTGKWLSFPLILTFKAHEPRCSFGHNKHL